MKINQIKEKIERESKGQFPSKNCECHFQEPYGFVPEADCPEHDTKQFTDFLNLLKQKLAEEIIDVLEKEQKKDEKNLGLWETGQLTVTEPDEKEREIIKCEFRAIIHTIKALKQKFIKIK